MEFCAGGSLDNHLEKFKEKIADGERLLYLYGICRGMRCLHGKNFVHRDLVARNCLIANNGVIKISDFGLACSSDYGPANMSIKNIPLRWMAPETLVRTPAFSFKSDVWAFGVLMYEGFNLGIKPWADEEDCKKISGCIKRGEMPELPERTHPPMKEVIRSCWNAAPANRPEFRDLLKTIHTIHKQWPQFKFPRAADCTTNKIPGVVREDDGSGLTDDVPEKIVTYITAEQTPIISKGTSEEGIIRESKESAEDLENRGIRITRKPKFPHVNAIADGKKY